MGTHVGYGRAGRYDGLRSPDAAVVTGATVKQLLSMFVPGAPV